MWFSLSLLALVMLVARRSTEKKVSRAIDPMTLGWLQQLVAIPFIIVSLFFAKFYLPTEVSANFWYIMAIYVACTAIDLFCYFKALSLADVSYVAPLLSLIAVGNIVGAYFVLGQSPTVYGMAGAVAIISGAYIINHAKMREKKHRKNNMLALLLVLVLVVIRGYYSNIELFMLREVNPTTFNFYSSILTVPLLLLFAVIFHRVKQRRNAKTDNSEPVKYVAHALLAVKNHVWPLVFIGLTYTINLTATYQAKMLSPNAGYVGAIKSAQVLPMVLIGAFFFREKMNNQQWIGVIIISLGLIGLSMN